MADEWSTREQREWEWARDLRRLLALIESLYPADERPSRCTPRT